MLGVVFSLEVLFVAFTDFAQTVAIELVFSAEGLVAWLAFVLFKGGVGVFVPFSVVSSEKAQIAESTLIFSLVCVASLVPQFFLLPDETFWAVVAFKFSMSRLACIVLAVFLHLAQSTGIHCSAVRGRRARGTFRRSNEPLWRATSTFSCQIQLLKVGSK